jgi:hypothetical protein
LAGGVAHRGILHEAQIGADADGAQIADNSFRLVALAIGVEVDVEAVGEARLGEQRLGLRRIVIVARRDFIRAA